MEKMECLAGLIVALSAFTAALEEQDRRLEYLPVSLYYTFLYLHEFDYYHH